MSTLLSILPYVILQSTPHCGRTLSRPSITSPKRAPRIMFTEIFSLLPLVFFQI